MLWWPKRLSPEERVAEHKRIRARGKGFYILTRGVLVFGAFTFLIDLVVSVLLEHWHLDFKFVIGKMLQWGFSGLFYGWWMWRIEFDSDEDEG
jgi:hypothetical protein